MYEFHSLAMVVPLLPWALYFLERQISWAYWLTLALILLTREDMSLVACGIGLYLVDNLRQRGKGIGTIAVAILYLAVVKLLVMADASLLSTDSYSYRAHFEQMIPQEDGGARDILLTLFTNPIYALRVAFEERKILFLLLLLIPMLALPLCAARRRVLLLYGALFCLLSSKPGPHSIYKQYTSVLLPFLLALLPYAVASVSASARARLARSGSGAGAQSAPGPESWLPLCWSPGSLACSSRTTRSGSVRCGSPRTSIRPGFAATRTRPTPSQPRRSPRFRNRRPFRPRASWWPTRPTAKMCASIPAAGTRIIFWCGPPPCAARGSNSSRPGGRTRGFEELASQGGVVLLRRLAPATSEGKSIGDPK